ncbi:hypothetical protein F5Y07DRAFT_381530 [Xylaria sp. FL0933]|nr:hypothetical protein F5Y07DRAFT_381530 [Xylaria sp. FL0933]
MLLAFLMPIPFWDACVVAFGRRRRDGSSEQQPPSVHGNIQPVYLPMIRLDRVFSWRAQHAGSAHLPLIEKKEVVLRRPA